MAAIRTYRQLETWQSGMMLVERCYKASRRFPDEERFGLTSQLRRAAVSIPCNLAEGACRRSTNVFMNHVSIALGSHAEVETCIEIAFRLGYLAPDDKAALLEVADATGRLLNGLLRSLTAKLPDR